MVAQVQNHHVWQAIFEAYQGTIDLMPQTGDKLFSSNVNAVWVDNALVRRQWLLHRLKYLGVRQPRDIPQPWWYDSDGHSSVRYLYHFCCVLSPVSCRMQACCIRPKMVKPGWRVRMPALLGLLSRGLQPGTKHTTTLATFADAASELNRTSASVFSALRGLIVGCRGCRIGTGLHFLNVDWLANREASPLFRAHTPHLFLRPCQSLFSDVVVETSNSILIYKWTILAQYRAASTRICIFLTSATVPLKGVSLMRKITQIKWQSSTVVGLHGISQQVRGVRSVEHRRISSAGSSWLFKDIAWARKVTSKVYSEVVGHTWPSSHIHALIMFQVGFNVRLLKISPILYLPAKIEESPMWWHHAICSCMCPGIWDLLARSSSESTSIHE